MCRTNIWHSSFCLPPPSSTYHKIFCRKNKWIAFEDSTSIDIKAKYARVRGLAGLALKDLSQDGGTKCGPSLLQSAFEGLTKQARAPRGAVLQSLEREILDSSSRPLDSVQLSPYRITRVVDVAGNFHTIRQVGWRDQHLWWPSRIHRKQWRHRTHVCFRILVQSSNVRAKVTLSTPDPAAGSTDASSSISYLTSIAFSNSTVQPDWRSTADTRCAFGQEVCRTPRPALEAVRSRLCPGKDLFVRVIKVGTCIYCLGRIWKKW